MQNATCTNKTKCLCAKRVPSIPSIPRTAKEKLLSSTARIKRGKRSKLDQKESPIAPLKKTGIFMHILLQDLEKFASLTIS